MADKNLSDMAKKMLDKAQNPSTPRSKAPATKKAMNDTAKTPSKKSLSNADESMDESSMMGDELPPPPSAKMKAKPALAPEMDPDKALMGDIQKSMKPQQDTNPFAMLERDLPKGAPPAAAEGAEAGASRVGRKAVATGMALPASELGMDELGGVAGRSLLERAAPYAAAGAAGLIPAAIMEGTLGAENAGGGDEEKMAIAANNQYQKTSKMIAAQKAGGKMRIPQPAAQVDPAVDTGEANESGMEAGDPGSPLPQDVKQTAVQPRPSRDQQTAQNFQDHLRKNFGDQPGMDDDLTKLLTETDLRQVGQTPGPMTRNGGPKNSPVKRPVQIKTRNVAPDEGDSEY
jgi:hypothetical protein